MVSVGMDLAVPPKARRATKRDSFHLRMTALMLAMLASGFWVKAVRHKFDFYNGAVAYPTILYWHTAAFTAYLGIYITQVGLVYLGKRKWHRQLGIASLAIAVAIPPLGAITGVVMRRYDILRDAQLDNTATAFTFVSVLFWDMILFAALMAGGYLLRKRPEYHRRLMFLAMLSMCHAGLARLTHLIIGLFFYVPDHAVIAIAAWRDKKRLGRVHKVYRIAWPLYGAGQIVAMYLWLGHPTWWTDACAAMIGLPAPK